MCVYSFWNQFKIYRFGFQKSSLGLKFGILDFENLFSDFDIDDLQDLNLAFWNSKVWRFSL